MGITKPLTGLLGGKISAIAGEEIARERGFDNSFKNSWYL